MPSALDHAMNTPQTAIGKGTVGEPEPHPEGKEGLEFKVALFFDGTMNNRTNTDARLSRNREIKDGSAKDKIIDKDKKTTLSSYANFYSNVAILELMNKQRDPEKYEVSVYVEGIGTVDFVEGATEKDEHGKDKLDENGKKIYITDAANSNDERPGYAFGTGSTGIVDRVTKGILLAKEDIKNAYIIDKQCIKKITIDVIGFSRGAAAARHFVSRYLDFRGPWKGQKVPELVINFVGLFETVSSYDKHHALVPNGVKDKFGELFTRNVSHLKLALGGVPKRVVHLKAQHEFRYNFALTNIDSSLRAGVGFEVYLPGVHSDVGGGYVEVDPDNKEMDPTKTYPKEPGRPAIRALNKERRLLTGYEEQRYLLEQGWYTYDQLQAEDAEAFARHQNREKQRAAEARGRAHVFRPHPYTGRMYGTRYLTNQYQYVSLYLMLGLAQKLFESGKAVVGGHTKMEFSSLDETKYATYQVPADLLAVRQHFETYVLANAGSTASDHAVDFVDDEQGMLVRNKYLHRSTVLWAESEGIQHETWFAYKRAKGDVRVVISDADKVKPARPVEVPDLSTVTMDQMPEERLRELGLSAPK